MEIVEIEPVQRSQLLEQAQQPIARDLLRKCIRDNVYDDLCYVGREAMNAAAAAAARLSTRVSSCSAGEFLADVDALAASLGRPVASPRRWWALRRPTRINPGADTITHLVKKLDEQRDASARALILLQTDRERLTRVNQALEEAVHLIRSLVPIVKAAAREMDGHDARSALALKDAAAVLLPEREGAVLTQWTINRQAVLAVDLLIANQITLRNALERTRTATLAALHIGAVARRAAVERTDLAERGAALEKTTVAATTTSAADREGARRMLDDAIAQTRAALAAVTADRR